MAQVDLMALRSAVFGSIANVAAKNFDRDLLTDGDSHKVDATIAGTVDGRKFSFDVDSTMTIGHSTERKSTSAPSAESILAFVLQLTEEKHGKKAYQAMLDAVANCFLEMTPEDKYVEAVDAMTESMAITTMKPVRGNVNVANTTKSVEVKISNKKLG